MRVLLVEDDPLLGASLQSVLRLDQYVVDWARCLMEARTLLQTTSYGVVLLDRQLPDGDGLDLIKLLRERSAATAILVLTALDDVGQRVRGLDSGADDYLVKPFDLEELRARMRVAVRRLAMPVAGRQLRRGEVEIDLARRQVSRAGVPVELPVREYMLLVELLSHQGRVLTRRHLEDALYGDGEEVESNAVEVHIHHLRRKFGAALIRTVRGHGYGIDPAD